MSIGGSRNNQSTMVIVVWDLQVYLGPFSHRLFGLPDANVLFFHGLRLPKVHGPQL